jgi:hypothetical protein
VSARRSSLAVEAIRDLLTAANGMHAAERLEYGSILPCGQGRPCHICEVIARAEIALNGFVAGAESPGD